MALIEYIFNILRNNPVIPIFLTIGLGFLIGQLKYKSFSLGPVAATLIIGVIIGQIGIEISPTVRVIFFMLFLFSIGLAWDHSFFVRSRGVA